MQLNLSDTPIVEFTRSEPRRLRDFLLRFGVVAAVMLLWDSMHLVRNAERPDFPLATWLSLTEYGITFVALLLVSRRRLAGWVRWLPLVLLLMLFGNQIIASLAEQRIVASPTTDIYVFSDYAARLVRLGENPYAHDLYDGFRAYRTVSTFTTPLLHNDLSGSEVYPPLMFLTLIPFQILGIPSHYSYVIFLLLALLVLYTYSPPMLRPVVWLPFFATTNFLAIPLSGAGDSVWLFFLSLLVVRWPRRFERGLWYGLACAIKQNVWLLAPFLLIRAWRSGGRREAARFALVSAGVFLLINLPFILMDPRQWLTGVLAVFVEPQIYLSLGLSRLTELGILLLPKSIYLALVAGVFLIALGLYWWRGWHWTPALWLLPGIAAWFSYRALLHYWVFLTLPLLLDYLRILRGTAAERSAVPRPLSARPVLALAAGGVLVAVTAYSAFVSTPSPLDVQIHWPVTTSNNRVQELNLTVTNYSNETIQPRFMVQGDFYHQAVFWRIRRGPTELAPQASGEYSLSGTWPVYSFPYHLGAQVVVADDDHYDLRTIETLPEDITATFPDLPKNGDFRYWRDDANAPTNWALTSTQGVATAPEPLTWREDNDVGTALRLRLTDTAATGMSSVKVSARTIFPEVPLQLWVRLPAAANQSPNFDLIYGVEMIANGHQLWVLFGDSFETGQLDAGLPFVMLPAPRDEWNLQTLDAGYLFEQVGMDTSASTNQFVAGYDQLNFARTAFTLRLMLATRGLAVPQVEAEFGPLLTPRFMPDRDAMVADAIAHPDWMLLWRGDQNRVARNFAQADAYYRQALEANPNAARAYLGLGWLAFDRQLYDEARDHFQHALDIMLGNINAYNVTDLGEAQAGIGWILVRQSACDSALVHLDQARRLEVPLDYDLLNSELEQCESRLETALESTMQPTN